MILNLSNGDLLIDDIIFNSKLNIDKVSQIKQESIQIIPYVENKSLIIPNMENGEYSLILMFEEKILKSISIGLGEKYNFPSFVITKQEKDILSKHLKEIGGQNMYPWGNVGLFEDLKGGIISIVINYG